MHRLNVGVAVLAICLLGTVSQVLADDVRVRGYSRQDVSYVQPHMRSAPDSSYNNNWSTYPNINPYTGQQGTHQPRLFDNNSNSNRSDYGWSGSSKQRSRW
jgi:hypothetical protein